MKKYISFRDRFGKPVGCGSDCAMVSSLRTRTALVRHIRKHVAVSSKRDAIVSAWVFPLNYRPDEPTPIEIIYL